MLTGRRMLWAALTMTSAVAQGATALASPAREIDRPLAALQAASIASESGAADVRVNGVRMRVHRAVVNGAPAAIARALRERWSGEARAAGDAATESRAGDWTIVGRRHGDLHEVWQMRDAGSGRSELLVSVADVSARPRPLVPPALGLPAGARLLSTTESTDRGRPIVAQLAHSRLSPPQLLEWVRAAAAARGWQEISLAEAREAGQGFVIVHRRGAAQLTTTAASGPGGARFVFNQVGSGSP